MHKEKYPLENTNNVKQIFLYKKKFAIGITGVILILIAAAVYNQSLLKAYYNNYTVNKFRNGDSVYAYKNFVSDVYNGQITLYRLAKSTSSSDLKWLNSGMHIMSYDLAKNRSSYIGTYIKVKFVPYIIKGKSAIASIYAIKPDWKIVKKTPALLNQLPKNFEYADTDLYINWAVSTNKELNSFPTN